MRELSGTAIREARTGHSGGASNRRGVIVATVAAFLMTITGAFDTDLLGVGARLVYWLIIMEAGALIGIGATAAVRGWGRLAQRPWLEGAAISLAIAAPLTLVVLGTTAAFVRRANVSPAGLAMLFLMVLAVTAAITAINLGARPAASSAEPIPPVPAPAECDATPPPLAERLPPHVQGAPIHALEAEDHYLRVHTGAGSVLILMRLGDAIALLDGVAGERTHRSWWVARDAVRAVERKDGRAALTLADDTIAPVSRSAYPRLRDAGWFD
ncbi:LytTR family DNA-binding domain-containing protein [Sphingomonas sp. RS6]